MCPQRDTVGGRIDVVVSLIAYFPSVSKEIGVPGMLMVILPSVGSIPSPVPGRLMDGSPLVIILTGQSSPLSVSFFFSSGTFFFGSSSFFICMLTLLSV